MPPADWQTQYEDRLGRRDKIGVNALELVPPGKLDARSGGLAFFSTRAAVSPTGERALVTRAHTSSGAVFAPRGPPLCTTTWTSSG